MKYIGIDFGTSNSLASLVRNNQIEFLKFSNQQISNPTVIYFPEKSKHIEIGTVAIERYLHDLEEHESVGRLMLSIKTLLPEANFDQTVVIGHGPQTAAKLAAKFLSALKQMAEKQFNEKFEGVVLGRPVDFSELAVTRLEEAARLAGFKEVLFWLEPVAAAMAYEMQSTEKELICVVDIGGGTSDICIIETNPFRSQEADRIEDIKATSGVNLAGDEMSSRIMRERLSQRFGQGATYQSLGKTLPFPIHIINTLNSWHRIHQLSDPQILAGIVSMQVSADRPDDVERLINLIKNHHGFDLFRAIDNAKKQLSDNDSANIKFSQLGLNEEVKLNDFESMIEPVAAKIEEVITDCLNQASVKPDQIKRVLLTGGSSQVPLLDRTIINIFGKEKIIRPDFFSSIATGLGYIAARMDKKSPL